MIAIICLLMFNEVLILMVQVTIIIFLRRNCRSGVIIILAHINRRLIIVNSLCLILATILTLGCGWQHPRFMSTLIISLWFFFNVTLLLWVDIVLVHSFLVRINIRRLMMMACDLLRTLRSFRNFRSIIS